MGFISQYKNIKCKKCGTLNYVDVTPPNFIKLRCSECKTHLRPTLFGSLGL